MLEYTAVYGLFSMNEADPPELANRIASNLFLISIAPLMELLKIQ